VHLVLAAIAYPPIPIFEVGPLRLSLHGLFAAIGFIAGGALATRYLMRRGYDGEKFQSVLSWALVGSLVGARYLTSPATLLAGGSIADALNPINGNFSIMGGFAGGILAAWWRMNQVDLARLPSFDAAAYGLVLGTIVGRIGDLGIVEHLGKATDAAWGYAIKPGYDVAPQHNGLECTTAEAGADGICGVYHHVAAYDMVGALIFFFVLYQIERRVTLRYGQLFSIWIVWYGLQRFVLDFLRFGNGDATLGSFTWNQVSGLAGSVLGVALFVWYGRTQEISSRDNDMEISGATAEAVSPA
jgi:phosphatidylglycerol:prolipoprotein diacylglycerol transferase